MRALRRFLGLIALVVGDPGYERYREHLRRAGRTDSLPTPQEFYLAALERRYAGPSRCC